MSLILEKFSFGVGDRFAHQAEAQLRACMLAAQQGANVVPVWNKSHREHTTVGSQPASVRQAADAAVRALGWKKPYHVDADHIRLETVDGFIASSDFYTIDVADAIGQPAAAEQVRAFVERHADLAGRLEIPGIERPLAITRDEIERTAAKYLRAVQDAGAINRHIAEAKGAGQFITEVSMDETDSPQTPPELLVILAALADEQVPLQTIAPKFTGRFNKGVDYVGNLEQFEQEFQDDLAVIAFAVEKFGLPNNLKLSVHSGSDKFSIYAPIRRALARSGAGVHLKTAGTTWLEEVIGLAEAGGQGLALAKEIYAQALAKRDALCAPYAAVIAIDSSKLPSADEVQGWSAEQFVGALRHDPRSPQFNPHLRQLIHVGYKIAAQLGDRYLGMLDACRETIAKNVTENLYDRHLKPLFVDTLQPSPRQAAPARRASPHSAKFAMSIRSCVTVSLVRVARGGPFVLWDDLPAACALAQELGFDAIEIFPPSASAVDVEMVRKLLADHNLKLAAVGTGAGWVLNHLTLTGNDPTQRERAQAYVREVIDVAGPLGASAIIGSMQGRWGDGQDRETALGYLKSSLGELGEHARPYNVPLIYEPLNRYETNLINTVADGVSLLNSISGANVKLLADLFHMNIEEADIAAALVAGGAQIGHVHFVDSNRRPAGYGHLHYTPIAAALHQIGYQGYLSAEALPYPDSRQAAQQTIDCFNRHFR